MSEPCDRADRRLALPALDTADVVAMNPGIQAQLILGQAALIACLAEGVTKRCAQRIAMWHDAHARSPTVF